jgi:hypothetical protein
VFCRRVLNEAGEWKYACMNEQRSRIIELANYRADQAAVAIAFWEIWYFVRDTVDVDLASAKSRYSS